MSFFTNFWWSQELDILKERSVAFEIVIEKTARSGRINKNRNVDRTMKKGYL